MAVHSVTDDTGQGGWQDTQPTEPIGTTTPCPQLGKRHRWKGGDVCTVCGATKADARTEAKPDKEPKPERASVRVGAFETLGALVWAGLGAGIRYQPVLMAQNVKREDGTEVEGKKVKDVIGKVFVDQAAMAGKRIDKAFHKASPFWYGIVARYMNKATWATELAPLFITPLFVYILAAYPKVAATGKEQMIGFMLPVFLEQAKLAQQQRDLMQQFEGINKDTMAEALHMINSLLGTNEPK